MANRPNDSSRSDAPSRRFHPVWIVMVVVATLLLAGLVAIPAVLVSETKPPAAAPAPSDASGQNRNGAGSAPAVVEQSPSPGKLRQAKTVQVDFSPPADEDMPSGPFGDAVRLGQKIFTDTQTYARPYVGNKLRCVNCHLGAGRKADSAPLWAAYGMFPAYREKNKRVNTYEDRLTGCFRFSMNGKAPPRDSKEMVALVSYSYWLAKGAPTGVALKGRGYPKLAQPARSPDATRGKAVFDANCAICHGADGHGTQANGGYAFPPLWGPNSFNEGAGMARVPKAAAFIHANMPLGKGNSLSEQDAWDVAQYMDSQPRPPDPRVAKSR
ncbi:MAG: c-type cytochrome [Betaproteobacteria bacterium]|nr:c-type cytochrome [Betaproteobacteria bacterium]